MRVYRAIVAAALATLISSTAPGVVAGGLIVNGSFEEPVAPAGGGISFGVGSTGLTGWTVLGPAGTNVDLLSDTYSYQGTTINAQSGVQSVDLSGSSDTAGSGLSQVVATTVGTTYELSFWVGRAAFAVNPGTGATDLTIDGAFIGTFTNPNTTPNLINWMNFTYDFTATSASTTIAFTTHQTLADEEVGLDNVSLTATVPEPSTLVLAGTAILGLAVGSRRRKRVEGKEDTPRLFGSMFAMPPALPRRAPDEAPREQRS
jgi:hypothetical protein